jgi:hypothetical protein
MPRGSATRTASGTNLRLEPTTAFQRFPPVHNKTGETEPFPYGDDRLGAPLRDDLSFPMLEKDL